ncbi:MAG TPA: M20 family metallo-hydrolase [Candidatus Nanoarchaeia archaeon]|nr:M20 family metallo-hydrolase [Candidatus Nanoarchaeia archaeon]
MAEKIDAAIEELKGQMLDTLGTLCTFEAIAPESEGQGEMPKAKYLEKLCKKLGFTDITWVNSKDERVPEGERPNLIVKLPGKSKKRLWFLSHLDVVPPGDIEAWETEPFEPVWKKSRLYGRGAIDNNQSAVATLFALKALKDAGITPEREICLAFVCDEEVGSEYGVKYLIKKKIFSKDDIFVVPDSGNNEGTQIEVAEKSILWLKIKIKGKQAHGSTPEKGNNAAYAAAKLAVSLRDTLYDKFDHTDMLFEPPNSTFEPTKHEPNVLAVNIIPGSDVFYMDCRVLPNYKLDDVLAEIKLVMGRIEKETKVKVEFDEIQRVDAPKPTDPNHPLVKELKRAIKEVYNVDAYAAGIGGGTFAAYLRMKGIPAVCWEKVNEDVYHMPNEYARQEDLFGDAKVFARLMTADL